MSDEPLSSTEALILYWLSAEDHSALGECQGAALDSLVARGYAEIMPQGRVRLTDRGLAAVAAKEYIR